jgi:hypothetical protein
MVSTIYLYFRKFNLGFIFILGDPVRKTGEIIMDVNLLIAAKKPITRMLEISKHYGL